jgi:hypothetical protein
MLGGGSRARTGLGRMCELLGGRKRNAGILELLGAVFSRQHRLKVAAVGVQEEDVPAVVRSACGNFGHMAAFEREEHDVDVVQIGSDLLHARRCPGMGHVEDLPDVGNEFAAWRCRGSSEEASVESLAVELVTGMVSTGVAEDIV